MNAENIAELLMKLSPVKYACDWDNVGMHVGHKDNEINTILVTLDIDDAAIDRAIEINADMIVSHHPLIFHGIKQINDDNITGRRIMRLIENRINAYCMHTNYDCVGGMAHAAEHIFIDEIMEYLKENTDNIEIAGMSYDNPQHFI